VAVLPRPLLKIASTKFEEIHENGVVQLPEDTDVDGVLRLIDHLKIVMNARGKLIRMSNNMDTYESMSVCAAGKLLGAEKYVAHVLGKVEAYFHNVQLPTYGGLDAALIYSDKYPRFLHLAVQKLAKLVREDKIEDVADFEEYLVQQPVLADSIKTANTKHANWVRGRELAARREQQAKKIAERDEAFRKQQATRQAGRDAADTAFWAQRKKEDTEDRVSIKRNLAGPVVKRKLTPRERSYWVRTYGIGTRLPRGA
jgi:hypothetical protein